MTHQYTRRTQSEALELARHTFQSLAAGHLTAAELEELRVHGLLTGGTPGNSWETVIGVVPSERTYYEFEIYKPKDAKPYIEKSYVRMLVPRDRSCSQVYFVWRPPC